MDRDSSPLVNDPGSGGLGFQSIRDRFLSRRNHKQHQVQGYVSSDPPASRSRPNHSRSSRRGWFTCRRNSLFAVTGFVLFLLCIVSLFLQNRMASVVMKKSEKAWSRETELNHEMTVKFKPPRTLRRFVEANKLDRVRSEAHRGQGVRKPRLALILANLEKDPQSLMLITVMKNMKELGYVFEIFAVDNGKACRIWEQLGRLFRLSSEHFGRIDWSLYEGIILDSLQAKEAIASIMLEPFCSIPLIWIIQDDSLAKRLQTYEVLGWKNLISHWKTTFCRASAIVFPNFALPMLYTALDPGNFHVILGSPVDVWVAEVYSKSHFKHQIREDYGFGREDIVIVIVGGSYFFDDFSLESAVALPSIEPLLTKYARTKNAGNSFKFVLLCGDFTEEFDDTLQEVASRLGLLDGSLRHYGFDSDVNEILLMADIVLYGSTQNTQDFPPLLIRAMTFGIPVVAPDLLIIKEYVVEGLHGILLTKYDPKALLRTFSVLISDGKLSRIAHNVAITGRLLAKNMFASECITRFASLFEEVLDLPSDVMLPGSIVRPPKAGWEWNLFRKEIERRTFNEQNLDVGEKSSIVTTLEEEFYNHVDSLNISSARNEISAHDIPTRQDWDNIKEIGNIEENERVELEELHGRTDRKLGTWERVYRRAKKYDKISIGQERDEGELERTGQPVCIYEIYSGPAAWPFLHHGPLYRGLSLSSRALRLKTDDVNAIRRLPLLNDRFYEDILCETGGMFAIANKIDTIHGKPWIGFQSWQAEGRKVALSAKAERVLEKAIQEDPRGEVIYFWAYLDVHRRVMNRNSPFPFWSSCDILNGGHCRTTFEDAFRHMYGLPPNAEGLPPMPDDGGRWSALHCWVMPTPTFLEFIMFARMFVDSLDAVNRNSIEANRNRCLLASSELEGRHCYCRVLEILVNIWSYHSGRRIVHLDPRSGSLEEQHLLEQRQELMWSKFFNKTLLKAMDEDLAEAADDGDPPSETWLWPLTGEVFWRGIYEREKAERERQKLEKLQRKTRERQRRHKRKPRVHKQKPLGG